jgi:hypothetical protein
MVVIGELGIDVTDDELWVLVEEDPISVVKEVLTDVRLVLEGKELLGVSEVLQVVVVVVE